MPLGYLNQLMPKSSRRRPLLLHHRHSTQYRLRLSLLIVVPALYVKIRPLKYES